MRRRLHERDLTGSERTVDSREIMSGAQMRSDGVPEEDDLAISSAKPARPSRALFNGGRRGVFTGLPHGSPLESRLVRSQALFLALY